MLMPEPAYAIVISHQALHVTNLERSTAFYRDVLCLPQLPEPFQTGMHSWFALGSQCQLHLIAGATPVPALHINHHLALRTTRFDAFLQTLRDNGVVYYTPERVAHHIFVRPDGIRQVFFQDPDGYWLELNDESLPVP